VAPFFIFFDVYLKPKITERFDFLCNSSNLAKYTIRKNEIGKEEYLSS